jgi:predicted ABC-type exoprotein transport system permease subunit
MFFKVLWALFINIAYCSIVYGVLAPLAINYIPQGYGFFVIGFAIIFQIWGNWVSFKSEIKKALDWAKENL